VINVSSKLAKKIKREVKKSPGKALALALLAGVAVWFWAPLFKGLLGQSTPVAGTNTGAPTDPTQPEQASTEKSNTQPQYSWKQIVDAAAKDPRVSPIQKLPNERDPFRGVKPVEEEEKETIVEPPAPVAVDLPPQAAGIALSSTIVGRRLQVARINGKSYRVGDMIPASTTEGNIEYQLISIRGKSVVLSRDQKQYELKMPKTGSSSSTPETVGVSSEASETSDFDPSMFPQE
jgi:hypothetical protein